MNVGPRADARAVVSAALAGAAVPVEVRSRAGSADVEAVTPFWILHGALKLLVLERWGKDRIPARQIARELDSGLDLGVAVSLVAASLGSVEAGREVLEEETATLGNVAALLSAAIKRASLSEADIDELLQAAESMLHENLGPSDSLGPGRRGVDIGPWDDSETESGRVGFADLGCLRVLCGAGVDIEPLRSRSGEVQGVNVVRGGSRLQLQAFGADPGRPWATVRGELHAAFQAKNAMVEDWAGPLGLELRVESPGRRPDGSTGLMHAKFVGCDGPGWLLRGVISGPEADPHSTASWAYDTYSNTIVSSPSRRTPGAPFTLRWPPRSA